MNTSNSETTQPDFTYSAQFMNSSFTDLLAQPDNNDFGSNWGFDHSKPKPNSHHSALPFSPTNFSPSSFLSFFDSPIQPSTSNVSFACIFFMFFYLSLFFLTRFELSASPGRVFNISLII